MNASLRQHFYRLPLIVFAAASLAACAPAVSGFADCPVTRSEASPEFIGALVGSEDSLQVFINNNGIWEKLPRGEGGAYSQKVFWKYPGYSAQEDQTPDFTVTGRQLDGNGSFVNEGPATNASSTELQGDAILTGIEIPQTGCWELTGEYQGDTLSFVVWVGDVAR